MKWKPFLISFALIAFLWASFLTPWTKPLWEMVDVNAFKFLNSQLLSTKLLQYFWAALNHKYMDLVEDLLFLLFFIGGIKAAPSSMKRRKCAQFLSCILLAGAIIFFINRQFLRYYTPFPRQSPSLVVTPCIRITEEIPWKYVKDETDASFPGDHATTLLLFGLLYSAFAPRKLAISSWIYVGFRTLPRLILGAHWISDVVVGSVSISLFFVSCFLYTPLGIMVVDSIEKILHFGQKRIHRGTQEKSL